MVLGTANSRSPKNLAGCKAELADCYTVSVYPDTSDSDHLAVVDRLVSIQVDVCEVLDDPRRRESCGRYGVLGGPGLGDRSRAIQRHLHVWTCRIP